MIAVRDMNIWKPEPKTKGDDSCFRDIFIEELNLSVRSYNCLKRAGCSVIGDILDMMDNEDRSLTKIRNLGKKSEMEIVSKLDEYRDAFQLQNPLQSKQRVLVKPAKKALHRGVDEFHLSRESLDELHACDVWIIRDLYRQDLKKEPGWYAVRELFDKV